MTSFQRKIHLDFHTAKDVKRVGEAFDAEAFADMLASAHVNVLATPGRCQYGFTYYDTTVGCPHPGLVRPDLFPETVRACVGRGIAVQAYFTLGLDDVTAEQHPEWRQRYENGTYASWGAKHMCFASPYVDEVVIPAVLEMLERCPGICGFWFDICLYCDGAFYSEGFEEQAQLRLGEQASDPQQRWLLARQIIRECCERIHVAIQARLPEAENYFNSLVVAGEAQNIVLQPYQEVENPALFGSMEHMTTMARWLREKGKPVIGLVSRFQGPWMDPGTIRTPDQMRFDVGRVASLGCEVSMGDHRHPNGTLNAEVYRRLAPIYADLVAGEAWLAAAVPCREAVLLTEIERGSPRILPAFPTETLHTARILEELGVQFDLISTEETLPDVPVVIWPGNQPASLELQAQLRQHLARGGSLLAMNNALPGLEDIFGVQSLSWSNDNVSIASTEEGSSPCGHVQDITTEEGACGPAGHFFHVIAKSDLADFTHVMTLPARLLQADADVEVLAQRHGVWSTTPPCPLPETLCPAIVQRGRAIYTSPDLFAEQQATGTPYPREVIQYLISRLLPQGRLLEHSAGVTVAPHLLRVAQGYTLHLLHWAMDRWGEKLNPAAQFPPLGAITISVRIAEPVAAISLIPTGTQVSFTQENGVCTFTLPAMHVWQMIGITI